MHKRLALFCEMLGVGFWSVLSSSQLAMAKEAAAKVVFSLEIGQEHTNRIGFHRVVAHNVSDTRLDAAEAQATLRSWYNRFYASDRDLEQEVTQPPEEKLTHMRDDHGADLFLAGEAMGYVSNSLRCLDKMLLQR